MPVSRMPAQPTRRFGLVAQIESTRIVLPLKGVQCEFAVRAGVVEVSMTQIFRQENSKPLDCHYLFPLPADASVYSCEADINGRIIRAQVRERPEAVQLAQEHKAAGHRTALVESERENLFTLSLTNLQPEDVIIVCLKYIQPLRHLGEMPSVEIPLCAGVRYIPGSPLLRSNRGKGIVDDTNEVPDASRISPVRIDKDHPDAAFVEIRGQLHSAFIDSAALQSPSHAIITSAISAPPSPPSDGGEGRGEEEGWNVTLASKGDVPDCDFILRWRETKPAKAAPRAWTSRVDGETYALLEIRAPDELSANPAPVDFYFLVDRSGSMQGLKWQKAVAALQSCVSLLGPQDRVMVTLFESKHQDFAECPLPPHELLHDANFKHLAALGTAGGTEMRPALRHVLDLARRHSPNRARNLILISDAQVGNEGAILEIMNGDPELSVHCFGIDVALNDALLLALVRQQGGTFHSLNPKDDIEKAITSLAKTLRLPVVTNLQPGPEWEPATGRLPNLYAGQIVHASLRSRATGPLQLTGLGPNRAPVSLEVTAEPTSGAAPYLQWSKSRIQHLLATGASSTAVALSVKTNLICPLTAFIAWDDSEKVTVADHELEQPNLELECCDAAPAAGGRAMLIHGLCEQMPSPAPGMAKKHRPGAVLRYDGSVGERAGSIASKVQAFRRRLLGAAGPDRKQELERRLFALCDAAFHPEWKPLCQTMVDRAFTMPEHDRHQSVAILEKLVSGLIPHFEELQRIRTELDQAVKSLAASWRNSAAELERFGKSIDSHSCSSPDSFLLAKLVDDSRRHLEQTQILQLLEQARQIEQKIHSALFDSAKP